MTTLFTSKESELKGVAKIIANLPPNIEYKISVTRVLKKTTKIDKETSYIKLLRLLNAGCTVTSALGNSIGIVQTTNRLNELIADGYDIKSRWTTKNKKRYKEYWLNS